MRRAPDEAISSVERFVLCALLAWTADTITKALAWYAMPDYCDLPGPLYLSRFVNETTFDPWSLVLFVGMLVLGALVCTGRLATSGFGLALGGGLSNMLSSWAFGGVLDPVGWTQLVDVGQGLVLVRLHFNVADVAVIVGLGLATFDGLRSARWRARPLVPWWL